MISEVPWMTMTMMAIMMIVVNGGNGGDDFDQIPLIYLPK